MVGVAAAVPLSIPPARAATGRVRQINTCCFAGTPSAGDAISQIAQDTGRHAVRPTSGVPPNEKPSIPPAMVTMVTLDKLWLEEKGGDQSLEKQEGTGHHQYVSQQQQRQAECTNVS